MKILTALALALAMAMVASMAACSGSESAPAKPKANAAPSAPGCIDEFVQEYEQIAEDPPRPTQGNLCFANGVTAEGPPKFPATSRKVRLEYQRGDFFVTQDSASWSVEDFDLQRQCYVVKLVKVRVVAISEGGKSESVHIEDGKTLRSVDTGDEYRSSIALGSAPSDRDSVPGYRMALESTPFGHDCMRATQEGGARASTCSFVQPHTCRSMKKILPAEMRTPNATGGTQVGRTTSFQEGAVDKSTWVLP